MWPHQANHQCHYQPFHFFTPTIILSYCRSICPISHCLLTVNSRKNGTESPPNHSKILSHSKSWVRYPMAFQDVLVWIISRNVDPNNHVALDKGGYQKCVISCRLSSYCCEVGGLKWWFRFHVDFPASCGLNELGEIPHVYHVGGVSPISWVTQVTSID